MIGTLLVLTAVSIVAKRHGVDLWRACACTADGREGDTHEINEKTA